MMEEFVGKNMYCVFYFYRSLSAFSAEYTGCRGKSMRDKVDKLNKSSGN